MPHLRRRTFLKWVAMTTLVGCSAPATPALPPTATVPPPTPAVATILPTPPAPTATATVVPPAVIAPPSVVASVRAGARALYSVAWSPDGQYLALASQDNTIYRWSPFGDEEPTVFATQEGEAWGVSFSPDGRWLAAGMRGNVVQVWDAASGAAQWALERTTGDWIFSTAWSPDSTRLVTSHWDGVIQVWDIATGAPTVSIMGHASDVVGVAWSPDGTALASAGDDNHVKLWNATTGALLQDLSDPQMFIVNGVTWSPDSTRVVAASEEGAARVFDAGTGEKRATLTKHTSWVRAAAWTPSGVIATCGGDRRLCLWNDTDYTLLHDAIEHTGAVWDVKASPDGRYLATCSTDRTVNVWYTRDE